MPSHEPPTPPDGFVPPRKRARFVRPSEQDLRREGRNWLAASLACLGVSLACLIFLLRCLAPFSHMGGLALLVFYLVGLVPGTLSIVTGTLAACALLQALGGDKGFHPFAYKATRVISACAVTASLLTLAACNAPNQVVDVINMMSPR